MIPRPAAGELARGAALAAEAEEYARSILVAVLLALFVKTHLFQAFQIPSPSMEPELLPGDHVLVDKLAYAPHEGPWRALLPYREPAPGDVAVFKAPGDPAKDLVKRIAGVPGDQVEIRAKALLRNGHGMAEPYAVHRDAVDRSADDSLSPDARRRDAWGPAVVPRASYFALGDNRDDSADSRSWGFVPREHFKGRALLVYWSVAPWEPKGKVAESATGKTVQGWAGRVRWGRMLHRVR